MIALFPHIFINTWYYQLFIITIIIQGICITTQSSPELGPPLKWRMITLGWAQDSWSTAQLPYHQPIRREAHGLQPSFQMLPPSPGDGWGPIRPPVWPPSVHHWLGPTVWGYTAVTARASHMALVVKNPAASAGDTADVGSIPGSGRSPGGGNGYPLLYSCLENPMNRGTWWATAQRVAKNWIQLKWLCTSVT